jgi:hypothetical protein
MRKLVFSQKEFLLFFLIFSIFSIFSNNLFENNKISTSCLLLLYFKFLMFIKRKFVTKQFGSSKNNNNNNNSNY